MKKIIILLSLIMVSASSFSQQKDSSARFTREYYLQKSKNQKTAAWILIGTASAISLGAMIHDVENMFSETNSKGWYITSDVMIATGITLFITSAINRRKAKTVSLSVDIEDVPTLRYGVVSNHPLPSLGIAVRF